MNEYLKSFRLESILTEVIYFIFGAMANAWFQSLRSSSFWWYDTSFIDKYKDNSFIYTILFFGLSYIIGISLKEIGNFAHNFLYTIVSKIGYLNIFAKYYLKDSYNLSQEDKEEIIRKFEQKSGKNIFYSIFEKNRVRYIGYKIITGFSAINFLFAVYALFLGRTQDWSPSILFFILFIISAYCVAKTSKLLSKFVSGL